MAVHDVQLIKFNMISLLLLSLSIDSEGIITTSPGVSSVCNGSQIVVSCSTTEQFLRWEFSVITESEGPRTFTRTVSSFGPSSDIEPLTVNSTTFMFSRTSSQDSLPLVSRLIINPVTVYLNGTALNCVEVSSSLTSTTTIHIIQESAELPDINIRLRPDQLFERDNATVNLEWNSLDSLVFYNVTITPELSVIFNGSTNVQLVVPYNTFYNVSVTPYLCKRVGTTTSIQLNYSKCGRLDIDRNDLLTITGYREPALAGTNVSFDCLPGSIFAGPTSSSCTEDGLWDPDPRSVVCQARCETPQCIIQVSDSITVMGYRESNLLSVTSFPIDCCSGILVTTGQNRTECMDEGQWQLLPNSTEMETETEGKTENCNDEVFTIVLVCTVCGFGVFSTLMFVVGFICGHQTGCCKLANTNQSDYVIPAPGEGPDVPPLSVRRQEQNLELKENLAYETVHTMHST